MNTERDGRSEGGDALAGGEFTDELSEGQVEADAESGSTDGTEDQRIEADPEM